MTQSVPGGSMGAEKIGCLGRKEMAPDLPVIHWASHPLAMDLPWFAFVGYEDIQ